MYSAPSGPNCVPITSPWFGAPKALAGRKFCTRSIWLLSLRRRTSFQKPLSAPRLWISHAPSQ